MNVLLINPDSRYERMGDSPPHIPYGILYLAAVLLKKGHNVKVIDRNTSQRDIDFEKLLNSFKPKVVGLSVMTGYVIKDAISLSKNVKKWDKNAVVVWGGVHPTLLPEQTLKEEYIDYIIRGEGEISFAEFIDNLNDSKMLKKVLGLSYRTKKGVVNNPRPSFLQNLDDLPDPPWHMIPMDEYGQLYHTLSTSRGCPFRCTFCYNQLFNQKRRAEFSAQRVIKQLIYLKEKYAVKKLKFMEDNFTLNQKRLEEICDLMIKNKLNIKWECESRVGYLKIPILKKMKKAGCTGIGFGVESGSQKILNFLQKGITLKQIYETFHNCFVVGIKTSVFIMTGVPTETLQDFNETRQLLRNIVFWDRCIMVYHPYPGSPLYDYVVERKMFDPPKKLGEWIDKSDVYGTENVLGNVPIKEIEDLMFRESSKLVAKNRIKFLLKHEPLTFFSYNFIIHNLRKAFRLVNKRVSGQIIKQNITGTNMHSV